MGSVHDAIRGNITACAGASPEKGQSSDPDKLMNQDTSGNKSLVIDMNMTGQKSAICQNHPIADLDIMGHMG
jgi:hypothetical protein